MCTIHDVVIIADSRTAAPGDRANMNRDVFPNLRSESDLEIRRLTRETAILGFCAKAGVRKDPTIRPDTRASKQCDMGRDGTRGPSSTSGPT
jgi:hypothetical protein